MRSLLGTVVFLSMAVCVHSADTEKSNTLTPKEIEEGWILLFDGKTTFGWKTEGEAKVEGEALHLGGAAQATPTTQFGDCELRLEYSGSARLVFEGRGNNSTLDLVSPAWHTAQTFNAEALRRFEVPAGSKVALRNIKLKPRGLKPVFNGKPEDTTEENIQARIRGNYLMALSNKFGSMLVSTGNKSELAVGYCTLYGDMAGGLAVISDVPKLMVYELAKWINRDRELIPQMTIDKPPSAELRPDQKDEDSLPPYDVLDRILKLYIEDLKSPQEIADRYDFDLKLVKDIALLVDRNEYKRKQAAPGLKITSRAFGFGRPFPIAQRFIP